VTWVLLLFVFMPGIDDDSKGATSSQSASTFATRSACDAAGNRARAMLREGSDGAVKVVWTCNHTAGNEDAQ
jgi:hypothetical protein